MCVRTLLDASAFRHVCESLARTAGHQLRRWITRGDGVVVYSVDTLYATELAKYPEVQELLIDFGQRGLAIRIDSELVQPVEQDIPSRPTRRSDDPHVLALAAVGRATVLFSCDSDLRDDFVNRNVLPNVGHQRRSSFPLKVEQPQDTTDAGRRRKFLAVRRCASRR